MDTKNPLDAVTNTGQADDPETLRRVLENCKNHIRYLETEIAIRTKERDHARAEIQTICARATDDIREVEAERDTLAAKIEQMEARQCDKVESCMCYQCNRNDLVARLVVMTKALNLIARKAWGCGCQCCEDSYEIAKPALADLPVRAAEMLRVVETAKGLGEADCGATDDGERKIRHGWFIKLTRTLDGED